MQGENDGLLHGLEFRCSTVCPILKDRWELGRIFKAPKQPSGISEHNFTLHKYDLKYYRNNTLYYIKFARTPMNAPRRSASCPAQDPWRRSTRPKSTPSTTTRRRHRTGSRRSGLRTASTWPLATATLRREATVARSACPSASEGGGWPAKKSERIVGNGTFIHKYRSPILRHRAVILFDIWKSRY